MPAMVVPQVAGREGGDEGGEADEHRKPLDTVGSVRSSRARTGRATMRWIGGMEVVLVLRFGLAAFPVRGMDYIAVGTVGFGAA